MTNIFELYLRCRGCRYLTSIVSATLISQASHNYDELFDNNV